MQHRIWTWWRFSDWITAKARSEYSITVSKVCKYGDFSGRYFSVFGLNTGKYGPKKSLSGHFSHSVWFSYFISNLIYNSTLNIKKKLEHWNTAFDNSLKNNWNSQRSLSYINQSINLQSKSVGLFSIH